MQESYSMHGIQHAINMYSENARNSDLNFKMRGHIWRTMRGVRKASRLASSHTKRSPHSSMVMVSIAFSTSCSASPARQHVERFRV